MRPLAHFAIICLASTAIVSMAACSANSDDGFPSGSGGSSAAGGASGSGGSVFDASGGSSIDDENCGKATYSALRVPANVLLLLDKSGSMTSCPDGSDSCSQDKWEGARQAIGSALATS